MPFCRHLRKGQSQKGADTGHSIILGSTRSDWSLSCGEDSYSSAVLCIHPPASLFQAPKAAAGRGWCPTSELRVLSMSPCPSRPSVDRALCQQLEHSMEGMEPGLRRARIRQSYTLPSPCSPPPSPTCRSDAAAC